MEIKDYLPKRIRDRVTRVDVEPDYENQPNMREKVREYIGELDTEIERVEQCIIENGEDAVDTNNMLFSRIQTIIEVKNDLQGRLEEMI